VPKALAGLKTAKSGDSQAPRVEEFGDGEPPEA